MNFIRRIFRRKRPLKTDSMSVDELLSLMRHETHRIEKALYNGILHTKADVFARKHSRLAEIYRHLAARGVPADEPTVAWSRTVYESFENLEEEFISPSSGQPSPFDPDAGDRLLDTLKNRRSVRVWADSQPSADQLNRVVCAMLEAARWAPNSGNRQACRFAVLDTPQKKALLENIKERHCTSAPLLIFVGADTRLYGALGDEERCMYLDTGAAIMQMLLVAHTAGLGACWNHFADDLITSRPRNREIYQRFTTELDIPDYIAPVAVVAVGAARFIPPVPARMSIDSFRMVIDEKPPPDC